MSQITVQELWAILSDREQMVIRETKDGKYIPGLDDVYDGLTAKGYIAPVDASMTLRPGKDYSLTISGELLLSQAAETFEGMDLRVAAEYYKHMYESSNASHAATVASLQAELAAALARAQAAEGEAARLWEALEQVADELTSAATDNRYGAERNWESYWHSACTASSIAEEVLDR